MKTYRYNFGCYELTGYVEAKNKSGAVKEFINQHPDSFDSNNSDHLLALQEAFSVVYEPLS